MTQKIIYGVDKMAAYLGVSRFTVYKLINKGMPYIQISEKKRAFYLEDVTTWLKNN